MDIVTIIIEGSRVGFGFLNLLFVPGFVLSLVLFPRLTDLGVIQRLAYSTVLSIGSVIALVLFMDVVLGVDTTPRNISFGLGVFSASLLLIWICEIWYLSTNLPARLHRRFSAGYRAFQRYFSRSINSRRDRFTQTVMTGVVWHENVKSGRNHVDHSYLIDIGKEIEIQRVDENQWKIAGGPLIPPPHPKTRYFELAIREYKEDGVSLIDDLQVYPVVVTKKPEVTLTGRRIKRTIPTIVKRIYEKTQTAEIQWIYSHDFHLFAILFSHDTIGQMVDRVLIKLDEIAISIRSGSRVSSHVEETQMLRDEFDIVLERPRRVPARMTTAAKYQQMRVSTPPTESDRRQILAEITRDLHVHHVTPATFRSSDGGITKVKIPEKAGVDKIRTLIKDLDGDDWLYE
jgi:hypothetical protein